MAVKLNGQGHRSCRQACDNLPAWERCPAVASLWGVLWAASGLQRGLPCAPWLTFFAISGYTAYDRDQACPQSSTVAGDILEGFHFTGSPV